MFTKRSGPQQEHRSLSSKPSHQSSSAGGSGGMKVWIGILVLFLLIHVIFLYSGGDATNSLKLSSSELTKGLTGFFYSPSWLEKYMLDHANDDELGFHQQGNATHPLTNPQACEIWNNKTLTNNKEIHGSLQIYLSELQLYNQRLDAFTQQQKQQHSIPKDLRSELLSSNYDICQQLELDPNGLSGLFASGSLSKTSKGWVEPLLPPLRHPNFCNPKLRPKAMLQLSYLIHDFGHYCRQLKPHSRLIFMDIGASLDFHFDGEYQPSMYLIQLYQTFGFRWDHIYAFELTAQDPQKVFDSIPEELLPMYHWYNVGVTATKESKSNPWKLLLNHFDADDFIVVKLDIDSSQVELPLIQQLLKDPRLAQIIDVFYFEHHVHFREMARFWKDTMNGTLADSLRLFADLRAQGISAHSWI